MTKPHLIATLFMSLLLIPQGSSADVIRLKNGGELRGTIKSSDESQTVIQTLSGANITLAAGSIEFAVKRSLLEEEYELRLAAAPGTAAAHWELADWCHANKLRQLRKNQLREVLLRDPHHEKARRLLGYVQQDDLSWMTRDQVYWRRGYVKGRRKFQTRQERDSLAKTQAQRDAEADWSRRVNRLSDIIRNADQNSASAAINELQSIRDPMAVSSLTAFFRDSPSEVARLAFVRALGRIPHTGAVPPLVDQAVFDRSPLVRSSAVDAIPESAAETATESLAEYLSHYDNMTVNRAAEAIARIGHRSGVKRLAESLTTLHEYSARVSTAEEATQRAAGLNEREDLTPREIILVLQAGFIPRRAVNATTEDSNGLVQITYPHRNVEVRNALSAFSEQPDFPTSTLLKLARSVADVEK